jgi:hypothetical protein
VAAARDRQLLAGHRGSGFAERFAVRERMEAIVVIAALERVGAPPVHVEAGAAGNEEAEMVAVLVEFAFEPSLPAPPLVQLVENDERLPARPTRGANLLAVGAVVPAQVEPAFPGRQDPLGERRLADLARSGDEDHLAREVVPDGSLQIARLVHRLIVPQGKKSRDFFCLRSKNAGPRPE